MALKLGIALGSGSARGWSHIGILEALAERDLHPDVVAGASVGSLVAAAYASDNLAALKDWANTLGRMEVFRLLDTRLTGGGLMRGRRIMGAISDLLGDRCIEDLARAYGAVATELSTGREVWLRDGSLLQSVRASSGLPGLFAPLRLNNTWLVDGGLVNPVPVSLCKALGADLVIAVNLNAHIVSRHRHMRAAHSDDDDAEGDSQLESLMERVGAWLRSPPKDGVEEPGILDVVGASINIMQDRITRSRMVGEPPEVILTPHLEDFQLMDFHRASAAIEAGRGAVLQATAQLDVLQARLRGG